MCTFKIFFNEKSLFFVAFGICLGITLSIIGCGVYKEWWPLFASTNLFCRLEHFFPKVFLFFISPFPDLFARSFSSNLERGDDKDHTLGLEHLGAFGTGFFMTCAFGLFS